MNPSDQQAVRAAAERLLGSSTEDHGLGREYVQRDLTGRVRYNADLTAVTEFVLSVCPSDDAEGVTTDRLRRAGFTTAVNDAWIWSPAGRGGVRLAFSLVNTDAHERWQLVGPGEDPAFGVMLGAWQDVRLLCRALGVELKGDK